ncbi:MAG: Npt1/Npt2 family nucleotide transporter [Parachlamydiales bacterium]|jgi:AAA family ATP:ADP antiporter
MAASDLGFSRLRGFFWPIYKHELFKFVPMMVLFFLISFNYHLLRIAKDTLIITAPQAGAEAIPFLKVWAILPSAIFMTYLFTKASGRFSKEKVFYVMSFLFLLFFVLFTFVLYPRKDLLTLDRTADFLQQHLPAGFKGLVSIIRYWLYSLFYVMSESWSTIMLSVLIWGFANDVTRVSEAKRFYPLFGIGINAAGIFAGQFDFSLATYMQSQASSLHPLIKMLGGKTSWDQTLFSFMFVIILFTLAALLIYKFLHLYVFKERQNYFLNSEGKRPKTSLKQTIQYVLSSKYLLYIALIVLFWNIAINLSEVLWKTEMKELFPAPSDYTAYMGRITFWIGILATSSSYLFSGNFIRRFGWKSTACITPLIFLTVGLSFFGFLFYKEYFPASTLIWGLAPLSLTVFFGSFLNILSRSAKYTVFDASKEIALVPLPEEAKTKGKAAIDGIGSRLGKSGSSLIMQVLLIFFQSASAASPVIFLVLLIIIPLWLLSIGRLNRLFEGAAEKTAA